MKRFIFSLVVSLGISNVNFAQENSFEWSDNTFTVGAKKELRLKGFLFDKWFFKDVRNQPIIDTLSSFLDSRPNVKINILFHSDERGSTEANQAITQRFSEIFYRNLINLGIDKNRLTPIGMGESHPLIPTEEIEKLKTKQEKEEANEKNRRVEIQITAI